jgi:hypothetical protein
MMENSVFKDVNLLHLVAPAGVFKNKEWTAE